MINTFDDITEAIADVIDRTPTLLRNRSLFYAAAEIAFNNVEFRTMEEMKARREDRVKHGMKLLYNVKEVNNAR